MNTIDLKLGKVLKSEEQFYIFEQDGATYIVTELDDKACKSIAGLRMGRETYVTYRISANDGERLWNHLITNGYVQSLSQY